MMVGSLSPSTKNKKRYFKMGKVKAHELRTQSKSDLTNKLKDLKEELSKVRLSSNIGEIIGDLMS